MDLGLKSRTALVCAASAGLGRACALALAQEGVDVTITGRNADRLEATARELRTLTGAKISIAAGDITTPEGRAAALSACPSPDILVNNAGGPPPGDFRDFTDQDWQNALNANLLTPIALIKAVIDPMIGRKFGRIVNITSGSVKAPIPHLGLSNTARTGLTGFVAGLSRQVARHNVTINNLLPGAFDTDRLQNLSRAEAEKSGRKMEDVVSARALTIPTHRIGQPEEFGAACAFLCSQFAGYIVGQNILLDGGFINSTL
ncbi:SDR family oxidoreductase [Acidocella aminolytica]|jgi:3-oxoacyl-[acyl-carrier protein] reductase|uniref:Oxidoreductase/SDR, 3-oxoacyl-(Acyl carrier protein) reductase n=1 Tax=Acidocella aminolytica 101 = DSM 11237 TaxID=1120923 RepID=A0A0D6PFS6_9PROT|nr:SDR family oxidoreductase [Acidocella aminolytica]GAN79689.1 oxidoreductase/SDR, 3-oxoacyl-(acyl carrier protein) reductase [Acidocella aminolytica 101 = DSM 11237]GBQ41181.1 dehydrogenase [Acidocella aminolytica 101 = DSM 11237]SHF04571.1 3-oxoacyl-[acyl-carrier protein] reductase [Acidocella aminolytica 101 = DSM 11237]